MERYEIEIVSHTHWDREWYLPFEGFRMKLVKLIDKMFEVLENQPDYKYYVLDGQTVVLEDYLDIKPWERNKLQKYISEGRVFVGPWYILPDEFLESAEALVRNLLIGHKIAKEFGRVMKVGYIPDPFGHVSQLPTILKGFGIDSVIFTRGLGDEGEKLGSEFIWEGADGSEVLAIHQIGGYCNAATLRKDDLKRAEVLIKRLSKYSRTNYLLFNNGCDHLEPQPELPEILKEFNEKLRPHVFRHSNFEKFVEKIKSANPSLEKFKGELRGSKYHPLLSGTISTRMYLKQANRDAEIQIEKITEPLATIAYMLNSDYPYDFFYKAWRYLLQCHPHDSICGCSLDEVHRDVMSRFSWVNQILDSLCSDSKVYLCNKLDTTFKNKKAVPIVVFNTLNWARREMVKTPPPPSELIKRGRSYTIVDDSGREFPLQLIWSSKTKPPEVRFMPDEIPPLGWKVFYLIEGKPRKADVVRKGKNYIENEYYRVEVNRNGSIKVVEKESGISFNNLNIFEDSEDAGDEYDYSPLKRPQIFTTKNLRPKIEITKSNLKVCIKVSYRFSLPEGLSPTRKSRAKKLIQCPLDCEISLYPGIKRIDFKTRFYNSAKDHRLRVIFPTNIKTDSTFSETHFHVIRRKIELPKGENWLQKPLPDWPQNTFTTLTDGKKSLTLISKGLPEYGAKKDKNGTTVALTLLRCVGWLSRADLLTRRGDAGPSVPTPEAQCIGEHEFDYSLIISRGDHNENKVWKNSYSFNVDLVAEFTTQSAGDLPKVGSMLEVEPEVFVISCLKRCEWDDGVIFRLFNISNKRSNLRLKFPTVKPKSVKLVNLLEEDIEELEFDGDTVCVEDVVPYRILTLKLSYK